ncbi:MAG: sigma 54-interacting transcriptional regulator, partial [Terriglobales bacterium]
MPVVAGFGGLLSKIHPRDPARSCDNSNCLLLALDRDAHGVGVGLRAPHYARAPDHAEALRRRAAPYRGAAPDRGVTVHVIDTKSKTRQIADKPSTRRTNTAAPTAIQVHEMEAIVCSDTMRKLMTMAERVARGTAAVLITGETGTGKELIARAIHYHSLRSSKPWVDVNCAALPEHLVESELFGYEKGAFSGADTPKPGLFELADRGTLFLDEIGELERKVQVKLLRVLDGVSYYRLGGHRKVAVDVRIVAATNRPLEDAVRDGHFRSDLFHRLGQIQLRVPPLRERPEDLAALAEYFLQQAHPEKSLSSAALQLLLAYPWPGNIRELRNVVLQAATMSPQYELRPEDFPPEITGGGAPATNKASEVARVVPSNGITALDDMEKQAILRTLAQVGGHQGQAANQLGISRRTLSRKLKHYSIQESQDQSLGKLAGSEQHYFRANMDLPVFISSEDSEFAARALNVSVGGMALDGIANPLQLSAGFKLRFTLPDTAHVIETEARMVWADPQGRTGIRF